MCEEIFKFSIFIFISVLKSSLVVTASFL